MGLFGTSWFEKRNASESTDESIQTISYTSQSLFSQNLFETDTVTEDDVMQIPTAKACVDLIADQIASLPIKLYREHKDGSIKQIVNDYRLPLLNDESNDFAKAHNVKKHMAKDYVLHGVSYVAKFEKGNKILELHPLDARNIVVNKRIKNGWRTVGADILLSTSENGAINEIDKRPIKFQPHELVIATNNSKDGLTGKGAIAYGQDIFKQARSQMGYTKHFYERAGLPLGLLKINKRLSAEQSDALRQEWQALYGGVKNAGATAVLQDGMEYQPLSPTTVDNDTSKNSIEICKVFNVPYGLIAGAEGSKHQSLEHNNSVFLANCLKPTIVGLESAIDQAMLLESEKDDGYFFKFDTSEVVRATESERIKSTVEGITGGLFTINEARNRFDLPEVKLDGILIHSGGQVMNPDTGEIVSQSNNYKTENSEDKPIIPKGDELNE